MKLSASIDLTARRAKATDLVNAWFDDQSKKIGSPVPQIHDAKLRIALAVKGKSNPPAPFASEAARRKITVDALCDLIIQKDNDTLTALMALEDRRQVVLAAIAAATSEQAITQAQQGAFQ